MDLTGSAEALRAFRRDAAPEAAAVSAATGSGLGELTERIWRALQPGQPAAAGQRKDGRDG